MHNRTSHAIHKNLLIILDAFQQAKCGHRDRTSGVRTNNSITKIHPTQTHILVCMWLLTFLKVSYTTDVLQFGYNTNRPSESALLSYK